MFERKQLAILLQRMREPRRFIQVVMGPRQVGKSTMVKQMISQLDRPCLHYSADGVPVGTRSWLADCWMAARVKLKTEKLPELILIIDEIQKIQDWSETVKKEWDEDCLHDLNLKVILLGSSRTLIDKGLSDSLAGRFERIFMPHWSFAEMHDAFGVSLDQYVYFGAYPGATALISDEDRWREYISGAIVDATINRDILINTAVNKPVLLRKAFELSAAYSGQELALSKIVGMLQDAGNITTIASYLELLGQAGLVGCLYKYAVDETRKRNSVPKHQVLNSALKNIYCPSGFQQAISNRPLWGHLFESAVGAHIMNQALASGYHVFYWRDNKNREVDYILERHGSLVAIEVKSNREKMNSGLWEFNKLYHPSQALVVGDGGMPAEDFLSIDVKSLF